MKLLPVLKSVLIRKNVEESDDHERDLGAEEDGNDYNEHQCGGLGIPLAEEGMEAEIISIYDSLSSSSYIMFASSPISLPSSLQVSAHSSHDHHLRGAGNAGAHCPGPQGHQSVFPRLSFAHPSKKEEI